MSKPGPFDQHKLSPEGVTRVNAVRHAFKALHAVVMQEVPEGRPRSIAITCLEEACMRATRGVAELFNEDGE